MNAMRNMANHEQPTRTLATRRGKTVETPYTDAEALAILKSRPDLSNFGRNLCQAARRGKISSDQKIWIHILAVDLTRNTPAPD